MGLVIAQDLHFWMCSLRFDTEHPVCTLIVKVKLECIEDELHLGEVKESTYKSLLDLSKHSDLNMSCSM